MTGCRHCGDAVPAGPDHDAGPDFCCRGCAGAHGLIKGLGLGSYYQRRSLDPAARRLRPDAATVAVDYTARVMVETGTEGGDIGTLHLMVEGIHCAACVWLIEAVLSQAAGVVRARVNMTTRRLVLNWRTGDADANDLVAMVTALGYRLVPYDPALLDSENKAREKELLRALAVAGFAAGNVMLLSVSVWAGHFQGMAETTRALMHWLSALIALPALAYAGMPFYRAAVTALKAGRTNMDVPISLAVILAAGMSLAETIRGGEHAYFDSAITLLFFLLIGRYLDRRARGRARAAGEQLVAMGAATATVIEADGTRRMVPPAEIAPGAAILVALGERVPVDGIVDRGRSDLDTSLITGETVPRAIQPGDRVFAGTVNLSAPLRLTASATGEGTLLAEIVRLMENAEQGRARYVAIADRVARYYAPAVHSFALIAFLGWMLFADVAWQEALLIAVSVLIITCPCALALAVPAVQVIASGRLLRHGILLKSATALERLAEADHVVFDKTGTLTAGHPQLLNGDALASADLALAAGLAARSHHPLARALCRAVPGVAALDDVHEEPGRGLSRGAVRLGSRAWCGLGSVQVADAPGPEMWLVRPGADPQRLLFADQPRTDAGETLAFLRARGFDLTLLSGDRAPAVAAVAGAVGIEAWRADLDPAAKCAALDALTAAGQRPIMVGDGLNDAPALAAAHASLSPSSAVDISQTVADAVFQGDCLAPVLEILGVARRADRLVKQNFALALVYNMVTIPLAMAGVVTPLIAAVAMSSSSIVVILNSLRLARGRIW